MTDYSHMELDDLDDFVASNFDSEEIWNEYFASSAHVRYDNRIDSNNLKKGLEDG